MKLYRREKYLKKIRGFYHDSGMIKVITGVRRCGKSCIMKTIAEELIESGVDDEDIFFFDLDSKENLKIKTPDDLEKLIDSAIGENKSNLKYIFIDEVQNVDGFEELLNAYRNSENFSIFITGSNSYLLSGQLITKLTGRYIEFEVYTLDFGEYLEMKAFLGKDVDDNLDSEFLNYITFGGFPKTIDYDTEESKRAYVASIISEIFDKDITANLKIRNRSVFFLLRDYLINNFGCPTSVSNLLEVFNHQLNIPIKRETINRYIQILLDAKILYKCSRFDLKSKRSLAREEKYYLADLSFYFSQSTDNRINYGPTLENIVYLYARSEGYSVSVGKIGNLECDFIMRGANMNYEYVQVAMTISERETEEREYRPFTKIRDSYPRYLLTMDRLLQKRDGVRHLNMVDFMSSHQKF